MLYCIAQRAKKGATVEMTQINIRIPSDLKTNGDEVMSRFNTSASEVIRAVWSYMSKHQKIPSCVKSQSNALQVDKNRANLVQKHKKEMKINLDKLGINREAFCRDYVQNTSELMYSEMLDDYKSL